MFIHVQRVSLADVAPPRRLGWGTLAALAALSVAKPVVSAAADLATEPAQVALDWFYLFVHPLMYQSSPAITWGLAFGATLLLAAAPLLPKPKPAPVAQVSPPTATAAGVVLPTAPSPRCG